MTDSMTLLAADNPILIYWQMIESGEVVVSEKVRKVYRKLVHEQYEEQLMLKEEKIHNLQQQLNDVRSSLQ